MRRCHITPRLSSAIVQTESDTVSSPFTFSQCSSAIASTLKDSALSPSRQKYPKAVASLRRDQAQLLTFYDCPVEHWRHLRTTNVIESPFSTVRLRRSSRIGLGS